MRALLSPSPLLALGRLLSEPAVAGAPRGARAATCPLPLPGDERAAGGLWSWGSGLVISCPSYFFGEQLAHISTTEEPGQKAGPWASM